MGVDEDDSFKKPGAVPFKWEIKPGVPRAQQQQQQQHLQHQKPPRLQSSELPSPSPKLRPPPAGSYVFSPVEPRTRSFRSTSRVRSDRWRFDRPLLARPESVSSGCFFSPLINLRRLPSKKTVPKHPIEPDYTLELETLARWSLSSRKSLPVSPFRGSTSSSSLSSSSRSSSPRPVSDAEWAGFGLF